VPARWFRWNLYWAARFFFFSLFFSFFFFFRASQKNVAATTTHGNLNQMQKLGTDKTYTDRRIGSQILFIKYGDDMELLSATQRAYVMIGGLIIMLCEFRWRSFMKLFLFLKPWVGRGLFHILCVAGVFYFLFLACCWQCSPYDLFFFSFFFPFFFFARYPNAHGGR
jgi:hypothetical protein